MRGCPDGGESPGSHRGGVGAGAAGRGVEPAGSARGRARGAGVRSQVQEESWKACSFRSFSKLQVEVPEKGLFLFYREIQRDPFKFQFLCQQAGGAAAAWSAGPREVCGAAGSTRSAARAWGHPGPAQETEVSYGYQREISSSYEGQRGTKQARCNGSS